MLRLFQTSKISRIQFNAPNLSSETIHNSAKVANAAADLYNDGL